MFFVRIILNASASGVSGGSVLVRFVHKNSSVPYRLSRGFTAIADLVYKCSSAGKAIADGRGYLIMSVSQSGTSPR